jgi:hypothetical protein
VLVPVTKAVSIPQTYHSAHWFSANPHPTGERPGPGTLSSFVSEWPANRKLSQSFEDCARRRVALNYRRAGCACKIGAVKPSSRKVAWRGGAVTSPMEEAPTYHSRSTMPVYTD